MIKHFSRFTALTAALLACSTAFSQTPPDAPHAVEIAITGIGGDIAPSWTGYLSNAVKLSRSW